MLRSLLLLVLLPYGCHTTVYRSESEPVRIVVPPEGPTSGEPRDAGPGGDTTPAAEAETDAGVPPAAGDGT